MKNLMKWERAVAALLQIFLLVIVYIVEKEETKYSRVNINPINQKIRFNLSSSGLLFLKLQQ
jgi:hypothetical protein